MANKVKKTAYQVAAEELNEVMGLKPAIDSSLEDDKLKPYLLKAIKNVEDDDEFTDETQEVIDELTKEAEKAAKKGKKEETPAPKAKGKKAPEPEPEDDDDDDEDSDEDEDDDDSDDDDDEEQPEPVKPAKGKKEAPAAKGKKEETDKPKAKGNFVAAEYTRVDAVCDALKAKPKTVAAWSEKADALLEKKGGKANDKENKFVIKYVQKMSKHFDFGVTVPMA